MVVGQGVDPLRSSTVELPDGRLLGYAECGDADAPVVVFCHGIVASRLSGRHLAAGAAEVGVRVLAPDRPGIGLSSFQRGRCIGDWPGDVAAWLDGLGVERFAVVATSGGAPYALACGAQLAHRVDGVALVSPVVPVDAPGATTGVSRQSAGLRRLQRIPGTTRVVMALVGRAVRRSGDQMLDRMARSSSEPDRIVLADPEVRAELNAAAAEAFRQGPGGVAHEIRLLGRDWGIPLASVDAPVDVWHGEQDLTVSPVAARWLAEALPDCRTAFLADAGHLWGCHHMAVVLRALLGPRSTALESYAAPEESS